MSLSESYSVYYGHRSRFVFPDGTSFAALKEVDTSELMQYSQFTTAPMPGKQREINVDVGAGSGIGWKSSKWGNFEDLTGVVDSREIDSHTNRNKERNRDKGRDRDSAVLIARAMEGNDSAELTSYFEGLYTTKSKRVDSGGPVLTRPLKILQENSRAKEQFSRGNNTGDRKVANGITVPLRAVRIYKNAFINAV